MAIEIKKNGNKIFAPLIGKELICTPEEEVRQEYIVHLVNHYGYSLDQMAQEVKVNNSKRGQGKARADIVIWKTKEDRNSDNSPIIVIECKAEQITIHEEDYYQGYNYASWAGADFFVTTNLKDTKFFRVVKGKMPKKLEEVVEIPNAVELFDKKKIEELLTKTKAFTRDEFSKLLFKCHNIIRNNDKLSPEAAFDEISKILFMKIRYEREQAKTKALFSRKEFEELKSAYEKITGKDSLPFYQHFFEKTKEVFKTDEIFDPNDSIKIRETSFLQIVKELEKYNLSDTSDDIKGIAFEEFLGRTFRGELGQFFTPRTIVDYMVDVLDPEEGDVICDPCCGSGGFLIKAFEYVKDKIERDVQDQKEKIKEQYFGQDYDKLPEKKQEELAKTVDDLFSKLNFELDIHNPKGRLKTLSYDCIFGTDANPRMARTAKMNMIMHGDGHGGVHHHDGLLNVNGIFDGRFDVILTNPPFGSRVNKTLKVTPSDVPNEEKIRFYEDRYGSHYRQTVVKQIQDWATYDNGHGKSRGKALLDIFDVGAWSGLTEVLFMERCLNLLKPGGRMGIVLPEGVLNNSALQKIREYIEGKAKLINITSIPQDVFIASGATVKPSLLFLKKFSEEELATYQKITEDTTKEIKDKYQPKLDELKATFKKEEKKLKESKSAKELRELKNKYAEDLKQIENLIAAEIKPLIKERFDYPIPVIEVEKAGISSTGAPCENELVDVAVEFRAYRKKAKLWDEPKKEVQYPVNEEGNITRLQLIDGNIVSEPEIFYEVYAH
ncbi:N-6 DNA methylase [Elizabethkingia anophelis]|uniref:N-6 DNA methylase n=1 Tax=Elizabethkingia anophelis TaxID=1117645 RepID=UPI0020115E27|nr:N-6 DNA methylase [Elizabethkingia anophelis]EJC8058498.1 N-6 DNA methylase [Elizabethkingia anophelis]MCL1640736.1 N-6 DNA methylase [Elizabethkingia anophelis]MCL1644846.1 N-6 DNA methylase [Elizabethkingia anophelis]MCT3928529.1 N-6 DNA methylase [Elizabethkingia anophelis]MCT4033379.1 N-6 DNA methylase [Elizabethkingia anophelis]